MSPYQAKIAVIIPSYKVTAHILDVLARIGPEVAAVYVVDDCCPEGSGDLVEAHCIDPRVKVIRHQVNGRGGGSHYRLHGRAGRWHGHHGQDRR